MIQWAGVLLGLLRLFETLVGYLDRTRAIDGALAQALLRHNAKAQKDIKDAQDAAAAVRDAIAGGTAGLRDHDEFERD